MVVGDVGDCEGGVGRTVVGVVGETAALSFLTGVDEAVDDFEVSVSLTWWLGEDSGCGLVRPSGEAIGDSIFWLP